MVSSPVTCSQRVSLATRRPVLSMQDTGTARACARWRAATRRQRASTEAVDRDTPCSSCNRSRVRAAGRCWAWRRQAARASRRGPNCTGLVTTVAIRRGVPHPGVLGCRVGTTTLWRDVQAVVPGRMPDPYVDRGGRNLAVHRGRSVAVVLGFQGARLVHPSGGARGTGAGASEPGGAQAAWRLVARGNDQVRNQHHPNIPASTHRLKGWFGRVKSGPA